MTREIDNALLTHGGTEDIDIPFPALQQIVNDALKPDCDDQISQLRLQNAALEEANQSLAQQIDVLQFEKRAIEDRAMGRVYD